jgi:hypothetical protein
MSAFVLTWDHIGYLVNLGQQLDVRGLSSQNGYEPLNLEDEGCRKMVACELMTANQQSVASRYGHAAPTSLDQPHIAPPLTLLITLAQYAQALQWVLCYRYQSCEDATWTTTFAYHYTEALRSELESRIIACFDVTWTYEGPALASRPAEANFSSVYVRSPKPAL